MISALVFLGYGKTPPPQKKKKKDNPIASWVVRIDTTPYGPDFEKPFARPTPDSIKARPRTRMGGTINLLK